jgi:hypothetical protein
MEPTRVLYSVVPRTGRGGVVMVKFCARCAISSVLVCIASKIRLSKDDYILNALYVMCYSNSHCIHGKSKNVIR